MAEQRNYITPAGFEKLRSEYTTLLNGERPQVVATVAWAASNGDRSENADYIYGKRRLREIDKRLHFLQKKMESAEVIDPATLKSDKVIFGATVTLENEDGESIVYQIVGADEFDIKLGKISWNSPVAKALLGKKCDDEVVIKKPNGEETVIILDIQFK
ncbi:MAG: transcription elongation factor GreB [Bdellovibrionales bacterium RIFCSPHIGHO2_01_FULL_40_29]|nr:MAG: transcription elongation factor GreB [Bdellovibrionales bacterium RIFCSPHIGHO2_01_FULL_40_29]OFZ33479.1 MAG: transcription elongation factor GreB [Bdellovibrionales bacterium RIFCSPHIGHO2_02_FULL_40_15]